MQTLSDAFDVGYMSNRHARWFGAPAIVERLFSPLRLKRPSDFQSRHGRTSHTYDPAEAGAWWYRFFRREPAYVLIDDVSTQKMRAFRRSVSALEWAFGKPLIFKNLYAGLRLEPMAHWLPEAVYILIERDEIDNAQSILRGRHDANGNYDDWWSVPPPQVNELSKKPPVEQAVEQVQAINQLIRDDVDRLGIGDRLLTIRYEEFCADVHGTLQQLQSFLSGHGLQLQKRFDVPKSFHASQKIKLTASLYRELQQYSKSTSAGELGLGKGSTRT